MKDKTANTLHKSGRVLLGIFIAFLVYPLIANIVDFIKQNDFQWLGYYGCLFIILLAAFFISRKYPVVVGGMLIGLVVIWFIILIFTILPEELAGFSGIAYFCPSLLNLYLILVGILFILSGLIRAGTRKNRWQDNNYLENIINSGQ